MKFAEIMTKKLGVWIGITVIVLLFTWWASINLLEKNGLSKKQTI